MRLITATILCLCAASATAAVTCDQLGNIALATEQFRNEGESLQAILAEANKLESANNLTKQEMVLVRQVVQQTYDRTRTALEIRQQCRDIPAK